MDQSQYYQINAIDDKTSVVVRRGASAAKITGGGARWKTVNRPKRTSIVLFEGSDPYTVDMPIIIDGWAESDSIEADIAKLNQMKFSHSSLVRPTRVRIDGAMPVKGATWVIADIQWGDNVIWHTDGDKTFRYRQDCVVQLLQYIPEVALTGIKPFKANDKIVTVKKGQTVKSAAGGDPSKAKAIQKANGIRDPKTVKTGSTLRIPARSGTGHPLP